jgi:hypothetical protein
MSCCHPSAVSPEGRVLTAHDSTRLKTIHTRLPEGHEFWGPWRTDFNPYTQAQASPVFCTGHTVQCKFSIYAATLDGLFPQALVAGIEFGTSVDPEGVTPWWHMLLVGNWQFLGLDETGTDYARKAGGDNDANTTGFIA